MLKLISSKPNLSTAFQRVKKNHGCTGIDGVTIEKFEHNLGKNLSRLKDELLYGNYRPLPLLKILVDKGNGEARALSIPTVRDRVAQSAVLEVIEPIFEAEFENCSFAYRKGRSVKQAVYQIRAYYEEGYRWVVDADIDAFFDSVDHNILFSKIERIINDRDVARLIKSWIKSEVWDGKFIKKLETGIPQGSVISPILANLFLDELDEELTGQGYKLVRYADDFIVQCKDKKKAEKALKLTDEILDRLSLELDESDIVSFDDGFKFLGVTFLNSMAVVPFDRPKKEKKILYYPPPLNLAAYLLKTDKGW